MSFNVITGVVLPPESTPVPALGRFGLLLLGAIVLLVAGVVLRRRVTT